LVNLKAVVSAFSAAYCGVVKYADQLKDINPIDFALAIGRTESYKTEFAKGLKLALIIKERGL
jgi:hypothetical protein